MVRGFGRDHAGAVGTGNGGNDEEEGARQIQTETPPAAGQCLGLRSV
jgi:hypothetical protein